MVERNADGRYSPDHSDADILAAVRAHEPAATSEVGDELGISRQGADRRLRRLRDDGRVASKKIGASLVWFDATTDEPADTTDARERRETPTAPAVDDADRSVAPVDDRRDDASNADLEDDTGDLADLVDRVVDDVAAGWEDDNRLADRKAAARAVVEHAVTSGDYVGKSAAVDRFHADHPVDGQNAETWWLQNARKVLTEVGDYSRGKGGYRVERADLEAYLDDETAGGRDR